MSGGVDCTDAKLAVVVRTETPDGHRSSGTRVVVACRDLADRVHDGELVAFNGW